MSDWNTSLQQIFGGKRWIIANDMLASCRDMVDTLHGLGATEILCIAAWRGAGPVPNPGLSPDPIVLALPRNDSATGSIRAGLEALANLPPEVCARVDAFDPDGSARVIGAMFDDGRPVAGRAKYGARPLAWQRLEDKTIIDGLWDKVGVPRAPSLVVPIPAPHAGPSTDNPLLVGHRAVDQGAGTVQVGDNREGFHGGGEFLRWVRNEDDAAQALRFFQCHCNAVRIMPFLEGIPCSIHGMVFEDEVLAVRPCEMLIFRKPGQAKLHYSRAASFWDPPPADREAMRQTAKRVGAYLRETVAYRGAFTIDGIMTADGFRPTELNPRWGAALSGLVAWFDDAPVDFLNRALVEGEEVDWAPRALEAALVATADAHRSGGGLAMTTREVTAQETADLVLDPTSGWRLTVGDEPPDAKCKLGPSPVGGICFVNLVSSRTPVGPSAAPRVVSALAFLDDHWDLRLGPLEPAREVRRA